TTAGTCSWTSSRSTRGSTTSRSASRRSTPPTVRSTRRASRSGKGPSPSAARPRSSSPSPLSTPLGPPRSEAHDEDLFRIVPLREGALRGGRRPRSRPPVRLLHLPEARRTHPSRRELRLPPADATARRARALPVAHEDGAGLLLPHLW